MHRKLTWHTDWQINPYLAANNEASLACEWINMRIYIVPVKQDSSEALAVRSLCSLQSQWRSDHP